MSGPSSPPSNALRVECAEHVECESQSARMGRLPVPSQEAPPGTCSPRQESRPPPAPSLLQGSAVRASAAAGNLRLLGRSRGRFICEAGVAKSQSRCLAARVLAHQLGRAVCFVCCSCQPVCSLPTAGSPQQPEAEPGAALAPHPGATSCNTLTLPFSTCFRS